MKLEVNIENIGEDARDKLERCREDAVHGLETLVERRGQGCEYTGWLDLFGKNDTEEIKQIKYAAQKIRSDSQALVVIGIGGSYLGARAAVDFIKSPAFNSLKKAAPDIFFAGNGLSSDALADIIEQIGDRDFSVNVISKSGTTTEPAIAFRIFRDMLVEKYGERGASDRIFATTDKQNGALKSLADKNGYKTFIIPADIGGRYSVLTPVGLVPMAACGIDIDAVLYGAAAEAKLCMDIGNKANPALTYAAARNALYRCGKKVEVLSVFQPRARYIGEWWKQLFGESEGKQGRGILPTLAEYTADLHSMGQYFQQGERFLFETFVKIDNPGRHIVVPHSEDNTDNLNYLAGREVEHVNHVALEATEKAHFDGGMQNMRITAGQADEQHFGALVSFFEIACGVSAYMLSVNPFNQPGVEEYKKNMFELLGKPK